MAYPVVSGVSGVLCYEPLTKVLTNYNRRYVGDGGKISCAGGLHVEDAPQGAGRNRRATLTQGKEKEERPKETRRQRKGTKITKEKARKKRNKEGKN